MRWIFINISLVEVSKSNWEECLALSVLERQKDFVAPNYESILISKFEENCYPLCIYNGGTMVGFLMYDIDADTKRWELSRMMIDKRFQGNGYGKEALRILLELISRVIGNVDFYTSTAPENADMKHLISGQGFVPTGEIMWDEEVFVLRRI